MLDDCYGRIITFVVSAPLNPNKQTNSALSHMYSLLMCVLLVLQGADHIGMACPVTRYCSSLATKGPSRAHTTDRVSCLRRLAKGSAAAKTSSHHETNVLLLTPLSPSADGDRIREAPSWAETSGMTSRSTLNYTYTLRASYFTNSDVYLFSSAVCH